MAATDSASGTAPSRRWITRTVLGIVLATFFSDVSHEMATAVLPFYLATVGLGPAGLGLIEGVADFFVSISKLGGGYLGHHVKRKKPWASLGYLVTTLATAAIGLVGALGAIVSLRTTAWIGRGFRSPLRDYLLADAVEPTHFGRAYGLERAGDMLGAVVGPLIAAGAIALGLGFSELILWTVVPGLIAAGALFFIAREKGDHHAEVADPVGAAREAGRSGRWPGFPRAFWLFLIVVVLFGMGDFSRTFLIWIAARSMGADFSTGGVLSMAVLLYAGHNLVAALAAYPAGHVGDRRSKRGVLAAGYGLGVVVNLLLAVGSGSIAMVVVAIVLSGVYISIEETLEKAVAAELLPRHLRSLGFGILACGNAVGDMASSVYVGLLLQAGHDATAFLLAALFGAAGLTVMFIVRRRLS
ncbi:MAG: MFS transporter [Phycisphaeraceae bacterium]|nr:MFS transporter [Phycisphaerales bacterium]QOJ17074.1 MAG: MFS transporter [Phycisphaeraceae bacterium]